MIKRKFMSSNGEEINLQILKHSTDHSILLSTYIIDRWKESFGEDSYSFLDNLINLREDICGLFTSGIKEMSFEMTFINEFVSVDIYTKDLINLLESY